MNIIYIGSQDKTVGDQKEFSFSSSRGTQAHLKVARILIEAPNTLIEAPSALLEAPNTLLEAPRTLLETHNTILEASRALLVTPGPS